MKALDTPVEVTVADVEQINKDDIAAKAAGLNKAFNDIAEADQKAADLAKSKETNGVLTEKPLGPLAKKRQREREQKAKRSIHRQFKADNNGQSMSYRDLGAIAEMINKSLINSTKLVMRAQEVTKRYSTVLLPDEMGALKLSIKTMTGILTGIVDEVTTIIKPFEGKKGPVPEQQTFEVVSAFSELETIAKTKVFNANEIIRPTKNLLDEILTAIINREEAKTEPQE